MVVVVVVVVVVVAKWEAEGELRSRQVVGVFMPPLLLLLRRRLEGSIGRRT